MEQKQRLDYLVEKFKEDSGEYSDLAVPDSEPEKRRILRSLMNIRMPRHLDAEVQEVQDAFLQEDAREKGIVTLDQIPTVKDSCNSRDVFAEKISIWQGDITRLQVGAIVNAANSQMLGCFVFGMMSPPCLLNESMKWDFSTKKDTKYAPAIRHQPKRYLVSEKSIFNLREDYYSRFFQEK